MRCDNVCLWRRRSLRVARHTTASHTTRASLALACRLAPPAPSRVSRVDRRHDGDGSLYSRAIRNCLSACVSRAIGIRSLRSSSRRRRGSLARLSRPRVDLRFPRRRTYPALLVVTAVMNRCILAPFAVVSWRVPLAPSNLRLLRLSSRLRGGLLVCLSRSRVGLRLLRYPASLASLVVTTEMI